MKMAHLILPETEELTGSLARPGSAVWDGAAGLASGRSPAGLTAGQPLTAGFASTGLILVPPKRATSGEPYWASPPNVFEVSRAGCCRSSTHRSRRGGGPGPRWLLFSDQNG